VFAKPQLTVATKLDALDEPERLERLEAHVRALDLPFYRVSAVTGDGLPILLEAMWQAIEAGRPPATGGRGDAGRHPARGHPTRGRRQPEPVGAGHARTRVTRLDTAGDDGRDVRSHPLRPPRRGRGGAQQPVARRDMAAAVARPAAPAGRPAGICVPPLRAGGVGGLRSCRAWTACDLELRRQGPSYTVATLQEVHRMGWQPSQIFFIIGADAFADIAAWHAFPGVLEAANFAVVGRAGTAPDDIIPRLPAVAARAALRAISRNMSAIRRSLPSRDARATSRRRSSASGCAGPAHRRSVPAAVERHIMANRLYGSVGPLHAEQ
jgi:nicotinic acid mononucleotide adenylyltransferase